MKTKCTSKVLSLILVMLMLIGITPAVVSAAQTGVTSDGYKNSMEMFNIFFANNRNWNSVYIYGYYGSDINNPATEPLGAYPGEKMTCVRANDIGQNEYYATVPADVDGIVFSSGDGMYKTVEIPNNVLYNNIIFYLTEKTDDYYDYGTATYPCRETELEYVIGVGDADGNSKINVKDASAIMDAINGLAELSEIGRVAADVNEDGKIDILDATGIYKHIAGFDVGSSIGSVKEIILNTAKIPEVSVYTPEDDTDTDKPAEGIKVMDTVYNHEVGTTVTYRVNLTTEYNFDNIQASVFYDSTKLELQELRLNNNKLGGLLSYSDTEGKVRFCAVNLNGSDFSKTADVLEIDFLVKDTDYSEIQLLMEEMWIKTVYAEEYYFSKCEANHTQHIEIVETLELKKTELEYIIGDVNGDGKVNAKDAGAIMDAINGLAELSKIGRVAADVNEDGKIDILDATGIYKHIADIEVKPSIGSVKKISLNTAKIPEVSVYTPEDDTDTDKPAEGIKVMDTVYNHEVGTTVTYRVSLTTEYNFDNIQASVFYDSTKLKLQELRLNNNKLGNLLSYSDTKGKVRFCAASVNGFDFSETADVLEIDFLVKDTDYSEIQLLMEEMWIDTECAEEYYFSKCEANNTQHIEIVETLEFKKASGTYRYYFYMPSDWLNESTAQTGNTAGIYWLEGTNAPEHWPGVPANKADVEGVYYYDVPIDVTTITWNNYFDGGTDSDDPYYANDMQTRYIGTEYYVPMESFLYPKGTDDFDGMIYVIDPSRDVVNGYTGKTNQTGDWFYYYGNGEYGTAPIKGDSEILTGEYVNIDRLLGKEPEIPTPDETAKILKDEVTGITVEGAGNVELVVEECSTDDEFNFVIQGGAIDRAFDITLMSEGAEVQPDGTVVVRIPAEDENAKIIHISKDGTIEDMNAVYEDGFLVFTTTHFSVYAILEIKVPLRYEAEYLLGDANGDGVVNVKDATTIQKALAGLIELGETEQMAADVDESGIITIKDATAIQKYIASIDTGFNTNEQVNVEAEYIVINIAADKNVVLMINYSLKIGN